MVPVPANINTKSENQIQRSSPNLNNKTLPNPNNSKNNKQIKIVVTLVLITIVIILIGLISSIIRGNINKITPQIDNRLKPSVTPIPTAIIPSPVYGQPSEYASDPQILQLEGVIKNLQNEIIQDDLTEPEIQPPLLEKNINFK